MCLSRKDLVELIDDGLVQGSSAEVIADKLLEDHVLVLKEPTKAWIDRMHRTESGRWRPIRERTQIIKDVLATAQETPHGT